MTQYLVAIHHPDNHDPSVAEDEAMSRDIDALNDEMMAADVRFRWSCTQQAARGRCGRSPMVRCSSPTGHSWRPRSTSALIALSSS